MEIVCNNLANSEYVYRLIYSWQWEGMEVYLRVYKEQDGTRSVARQPFPWINLQTFPLPWLLLYVPASPHNIARQTTQVRSSRTI